MSDQDGRAAYDGLWMDPAEDPRETGATPVAGELEVVLDYLRRYRLTLELKCADLDAEQLARRSVPPSTLSLLGLVRHLAKVEHVWFRQCLEGSPEKHAYASDDDRDYTGAVADPVVVAAAWDAWRAEVEHGEAWAAAFARDGRTLGEQVDWRGEPVEVRDVLVHLVEEYARHVGHADLLRECIDGRTGQ